MDTINPKYEDANGRPLIDLEKYKFYESRHYALMKEVASLKEQLFRATAALSLTNSCQRHAGAIAGTQ